MKALRSLETFCFRLGVPGRLIVSAARSTVNGRLIKLSVDTDGNYINAQSDGILVSPRPFWADLRKVRAQVADFWLNSYTPNIGDVIFDVGAGIGEDTLTFAGYVGPQGRIYSFEASPGTSRCLYKTVNLNGLHHVTIVAAAVADRPGHVTIADVQEFVQNSLLETPGRQSVEVPALTLDEYTESHSIELIHLLKMNIEGAEREALIGFQRRFHIVRNVAIACHDWIADLGYNERYRTLEFVRHFLRSQGFIIHQRTDDPRPWVRYTLTGSRYA